MNAALPRTVEEIEYFMQSGGNQQLQPVTELTSIVL